MVKKDVGSRLDSFKALEVNFFSNSLICERK